MGILWPLWTLRSVHSQKGEKKKRGGFQTNKDLAVTGAQTDPRFQHWTAPKSQSPVSQPHTFVKQKEKKIKNQRAVVFWAAGCGGDVEMSLPGILKTPLSAEWAPPVQLPPPKKKPQKGLDKPIHQSTSVFSLGGTKQPTRPIVTSVDETTAERLSHTKRKVPLFVFGQGALLEGRDRWETNITEASRGEEEAVQGRAPKFHQHLPPRD